MRELRMDLVLRVWDACLCDEGPDGFESFFIYVCAAFLLRWAKELKRMEFQDLVIFLQQLPTQSWTDKDIEEVLSQAYVYQSLFAKSPNHLK